MLLSSFTDFRLLLLLLLLLLLSLLLLPRFALEEVPVLSMSMSMPMSFRPFSLTPMLSLLLAQHLLALTLVLALLPLQLLLMLPHLHLLLLRFQLEEVLPIVTFTIPCSSVEEFHCFLVVLPLMLLLRLLLPRPPCPFLVTIPVVALPRLLVTHLVSLPVALVVIPVALMLPLPALPALLALSLLRLVFVPSKLNESIR